MLRYFSLILGGIMNALTATSPLIQEANLERDLNSALQIANESLAKESREDRVENLEGRKLSAKEPILLVLNHKGEKTPIGITHFAHLTENFNQDPFEKNARTIDELAQSILRAVEIHETVKNNPSVLITKAGVPFYSSDDIKVKIDEEGILQIDDKPVMYNGKPLLAEMLKGEEGIYFAKRKNGDYKTQNPIDQRKGCGIFFTKNTREVYRG